MTSVGIKKNVKLTIMSTSASPTSDPLPTTVLHILLPHVTRFLGFVLNVFQFIPKLLTYIIPWSALFSPLVYLLAPVTTFLSLLVNLAVVVPYQFVSWFIEVIYPVYIFCGVACITGGVLGLAGRLVSLGMVKVVVHEAEEDEGMQHKIASNTTYEDEEGIPRASTDPAEVAERKTKRRRLGRDGRVKFEPSS